MDEEREPSADLSLKIAGQEANIRNIRSVNTIVTIVTMIVASATFGLVYIIREDTNRSHAEGNAQVAAVIKEQTSAIRESTVAQLVQAAATREQNCLLRFTEGERRQNAEWCKQVTGSR